MKKDFDLDKEIDKDKFFRFAKSDSPETESVEEFEDEYNPEDT